MEQILSGLFVVGIVAFGFYRSRNNGSYSIFYIIYKWFQWMMGSRKVVIQKEPTTITVIKSNAIVKSEHE